MGKVGRFRTWASPDSAFEDFRLCDSALGDSDVSGLPRFRCLAIAFRTFSEMRIARFGVGGFSRLPIRRLRIFASRDIRIFRLLLLGVALTGPSGQFISEFWCFAFGRWRIFTFGVFPERDL